MKFSTIFSIIAIFWLWGCIAPKESKLRVNVSGQNPVGENTEKGDQDEKKEASTTDEFQNLSEFQTISGKGFDSQGNPIPGAEVYLRGDLSNRAITNQVGEFELEITETAIGFLPGFISVVARYENESIRFAYISEPIPLNQNLEQSLALSSAITDFRFQFQNMGKINVTLPPQVTQVNEKVRVAIPGTDFVVDSTSDSIEMYLPPGNHILKILKEDGSFIGLDTQQADKTITVEVKPDQITNVDENGAVHFSEIDDLTPKEEEKTSETPENISTSIDPETDNEEAPPVKINASPTALSLDNVSVSENVVPGQTIGNFTTADLDSEESFEYTLVSGTNDTHNGTFTITDNRLILNAALDYESQQNLSIRVRSTDSGGLFIEEVFALSVQDANDAPYNLTLSNNQILEGVPVNTPVGYFSASDQDQGSAFSYELAVGEGDTDNSLFRIKGNTLFVNGATDFETKPNLSIRVAVYDTFGAFSTANFTIAVTNRESESNIPVLSVNNGISIEVGSEKVLTIQDLQAAHGKDLPKTLVFSQLSKPPLGRIFKDQMPLTTNDSFTQADLNNGLIRYKHLDLTTTADSFTFKVIDSEGNEHDSVAATFAITVTDYCNAHQSATTWNEISVSSKYQICTIAQWNDIAANCNDVSSLACDEDFELRTNLNFSRTAPSSLIGTNGNPFTGTIDGLGHKLAEIRITGSENDLALFRFNSGIIKNLGIERVNLTNGAFDRTAVLVANHSGVIENCFVTAEGNKETIDSQGNQVGALVANLTDGGSIKNSWHRGFVKGTDQVGGVVGVSASNTHLTNIRNHGKVTGNDQVGGLIGNSRSNSTNNLTDSVVEGVNNVGGLIGVLTDGTVKISFSKGFTKAQTHTGALIGEANNSNIEDSYALGDVESTGNYTGGLVGRLLLGSKLYRSYSKGSIKSDLDFVGGLVGELNQSTVTDSYAIGDITGQSFVGGLIGFSKEARLVRSYFSSSAKIIANQTLGGISGHSENSILAFLYARTQLENSGSDGGTIGGLVGIADKGTYIHNSYASSTIDLLTSHTGAGGLVAICDSCQIYSSYSTSSVSGAGSNKGGFIGENRETNGENTFSNNFWMTGNGFTEAIVGSGTTMEGQITGLSANQLEVTSNFTSWDFDRLWTGPTVGIFPKLKGLEYPYCESYLNANTWNEISVTGPVYHICTKAQLIDLAQNCTNASTAACDQSFELKTDLFYHNTAFAMIGFPSSAPFSGTFDGKGHEIRNINISTNGSYAGTFMDTSSTAVIQNFGIRGINATNNGNNLLGGLTARNAGTIINSYVTGREGSTAVSGGTFYVGGLVGSNTGNITMSYTFVPVSGTDKVGGLIGFHDANMVKQSFSTSKVSGTNQVGGLIGESNANTAINHATGNVTGTDQHAGGLIGLHDGGNLSKSYATGNVNGFDRVGGLVGRLQTGGSVSDSHAHGNVTGTNRTGGIYGNGNLSVSRVFSTGDVNCSQDSCGGITGYTSGTITDSWAIGNVTGRNNVGGIAGELISGGSIRTSFSTGNVRGNNQVGGVAGRHSNSANVRESYATGDISGLNSVGGVTGHLWSTGTYVQNSYSSSAITIRSGGGNQVGGLVGRTATSGSPGSSISTSYTTVTILGTTTASGGLVGENNGATLTSNYWETGSGETEAWFGLGALNGTGVTSYIGSGVTGEGDFSGFNFTSIWEFSSELNRPILRNVVKRR